MNINRKKQIIQTAAELFKENGYNAVSMRDLAEKLGIKAASLYNHIDSKEEILAEIIMDLAYSFTAHMDEVKHKKKSIVDKLKEIIEMYIDTTIQKTDFLACMNKEWKYLGEQKRNEYWELRENYEKDFLNLVAEGIERKELKKCEEKITAFSILSTLRTLYHWISKYDKIDEKLLKSSLQENLLFGIVNQKNN